MFLFWNVEVCVYAVVVAYGEVVCVWGGCPFLVAEWCAFSSVCEAFNHNVVYVAFWYELWVLYAYAFCCGVS